MNITQYLSDDQYGWRVNQHPLLIVVVSMLVGIGIGWMLWS